MRRHLNTLYVSTQGAWLSKDGENVVVEIDAQEAGRAPLHLLGSIVCFGRVNVSAPLMGACAERGIAISHLTENGRFLARVEGPVSGNVLLRREQYRVADDPVRASALARSFVIGKIMNQRAVIRRASRDHGEPDEAEPLSIAAATLREILVRAARQEDLDTLRGIEGEAARVYFAAWPHLIRGDREFFAMKGRTRRPTGSYCL